MATATRTTFEVDQSHTDVEFSVRHMGISTIRGRFTVFSGSLELEGDKLVGAKAEIRADSIHTKEEKRDAHLRSADFFDIEKHPNIMFVAQEVREQGEGRYRLTGKLTLHGETRDISLDVEASRPIKDPYGARRVGFSAEGSLDRRDFGLTWNTAIEAGGVMVGHEVKVHVSGEATASD